MQASREELSTDLSILLAKIKRRGKLAFRNSHRKRQQFLFEGQIHRQLFPQLESKAASSTKYLPGVNQDILLASHNRAMAFTLREDLGCSFQGG